jgi:protein gp37
MSKRFGLPWGSAHFLRERLSQPAKVRKPGRVFVCSMGDLFHPSVDVCQIDAVIAAMVHPMGGMNHHTYILLTKRPERLLNGHVENFARWPNVWLGVTVENQKRAEERVPLLMRIPAAVRFVSVEPMLGPVDLDRWMPRPKSPSLDWVIAGPETGQKARKCEDEWLDSLARQCGAYGVAFFDKRAKWMRREFPRR